jgi:hypothetical protein
VPGGDSGGGGGVGVVQNMSWEEVLGKRGECAEFEKGSHGLMRRRVCCSKAVAA